MPRICAPSSVQGFSDRVIGLEVREVQNMENNVFGNFFFPKVERPTNSQLLNYGTQMPVHLFCTENLYQKM